MLQHEIAVMVTHHSLHSMPTNRTLQYGSNGKSCVFFPTTKSLRGTTGWRRAGATHMGWTHPLLVSYVRFYPQPGQRYSKAKGSVPLLRPAWLAGWSYHLHHHFPRTRPQLQLASLGSCKLLSSRRSPGPNAMHHHRLFTHCLPAPRLSS